MIWASRYVLRSYHPQEAGQALADAILQLHPTGWPTDPIILDLDAAQLISVFFSAFVHRVIEVRSNAALNQVLATRWEARHDFQTENVARWMQMLSEDLKAA